MIVPPTGAAPDEWRTEQRYRSDNADDRATLDALASAMAGLDLLDSPVWVFDPVRCQCLWANAGGLEVWQAADVSALLARDVAKTQSEAVYTLLNEYLQRVTQGEKIGVWVTLNPLGRVVRCYQTHHLVRLRDGRSVLLIEAHASPPAEELVQFATNHALTIGLYSDAGELLSGNPAFTKLAAQNDLHQLAGAVPASDTFARWRADRSDKGTVTFETSLATDRGARAFHGELRRVTSGAGEGRCLVSLFDVTENRVALAEKAREVELARSLHEKETLLKEIHHRVKNNLQIVASMLALQADGTRSDEARAALLESAQRVSAISLVHQKLYGVESLAFVNLLDYATGLAAALCAVFAPHAKVRVEGDPIEVNIASAVPIGLIINELVSNALKYGITGRSAQSEQPDQWDVLIRVSMPRESLLVTVQDHGPGLGAAATGSAPRTLGLQLVHALARQLAGTCTATVLNGTTFALVIPRPDRLGP